MKIEEIPKEENLNIIIKIEEPEKSFNEPEKIVNEPFNEINSEKEKERELEIELIKQQSQILENTYVNIEKNQNEVSEFIENAMNANPEVSENFENSQIHDDKKIEEMINKLLSEKMNNFKDEILKNLKPIKDKKKKDDKSFDDKNKKEKKKEEKHKEDKKKKEENKKQPSEKKDLIVIEDKISNNANQNLSENNNPMENIQEKKEKIIPIISENKPIHSNVSCDICKAYPIVGVRYNCTVCSNFDLCENCEENKWKEHNHPMIKIREPTPAFVNQPNFYRPRHMQGFGGHCQRNFFKNMFDQGIPNNNVNQNQQNTSEQHNTCGENKFKEWGKGFFNKIMKNFNPNYDFEAHKKAKEEMRKKIDIIKSCFNEFSDKEIKKALKKSNGDKDNAVLLLIESKAEK